MGIIKHRPRIGLFVQREVRAGEEHTATVVIDAKREVPIDWLHVDITGHEQGTIGSGQYARTKRESLVRLKAKLSGKRTIPEGRTELPFTFELPAGLPPSYRGARALAWYTARVRASIPWWPDARASFEIHVVPQPRPELRGEPLLFSTEPAGPSAREPHLEGSLASSVLESGGTISGALALGNVEWNDYRGIDVNIVGEEQVTLPRSTTRSSEAHKYGVTLPVDSPAEGESIPFRFVLPEGVPATHASKLWRVQWYFEAIARVRWRSDVRLRVPVTLVPKTAGGKSAERAYKAPPSVGSERVERLWRSVAEETGLAYVEGALTGKIGDVRLEVRREHRGRSGVFLVGDVTYESLGIGLDIRPSSGLERHFQEGLELGKEPWDRHHVVLGRELSQSRPVAEMLRPALTNFKGTAVGDERALVEIRGAGQRHGKLAVFCQAVRALAASIEPARQATPPPAIMASSVDEWSALAERLATTLDRGCMAARGELDGMPAEVVTEWSHDDAPLRTLLRVEPPVSFSADYEAHVEVDETGAGSFGDWPARGAAPKLAAELLDGARSLDVSTQAISLALPAPITKPAPLVGRLADMARLALALAPGNGPFR